MTGAPEPMGPPTRHLGLDLGGTNVKWVVAARSGDEWEVVARDQQRTRIAANAADVPAGIVAQLAAITSTTIERAGPVASVGIGIPGLYDPATGTARFLVNVPGPWMGYPIAGPVAEAVRVPAFLINDARAFGLGELRLGAGRGASSMVGLTLGTGVGGVVAIGGRVHQGHDGTAGEIGHQTIDPDGPWCGCGNRGCVEAYARADQIAAVCGTATAEGAVIAARAGDVRAINGLADVGRYLGIGIANLITLLSPDRVVIGGGVAAAGELLLGPIRAEVARRVRMTSIEAAPIVPAELGIWAGAIGAAIHGAECRTDAEATGALVSRPARAGAPPAPMVGT
jgi:glucokinase